MSAQIGVGADVPAALGDGVLARPRLARRPAAAAPAPARSPSRRSGRALRAHPTSTLLRSTTLAGLRPGRPDLSPLRRSRRGAALREWPRCRPRTRSPRSSAPSSTPSCAARSSSWAWSARSRSRTSGRVEVVVSLTTAGCPIRSHFEQAVAKQVSELDGVTEVAVGFDVLSDEEKGNLQQTLGPRQAAAGRARPGQKRDLRRLRQGRRRQVDDDRQPGRGADRRRPRRRRPRLRRLRLLDPAHARRQPQTGGQRRAQDPAAGRAQRGQGDVDRLLRRGQRRGRLARPDAPQSDPAVPRGRRLGRARVPAARPAARHRRRLDDPRPAASPGQVHDRHHAAAGGPVGRQTRRRHGGTNSTSSCSA